MKKLVALVVLSFPLFLKAQTNTPPGSWNATFHLGPFASGLPHYLEETMKAQGYYPRSGGLFGGGPSVPMVRKGPVFQLGIEKGIRQSWSGKGLVSLLNGQIRGFSSQEGDLGLKYNMITAAILGGFHSKQRITRIAVGPALHFITMAGDKLSSLYVPVKKNFTKMGFAAEAGLRFPATGVIFFDYNSQFHYVGRQDMGTVNFQGQPITFIAGKKSFNYVTFSFGLGLRLGYL